MRVPESPNNELLFCGFNQDFACFAIGTKSGFRIYNCDPFKEVIRRAEQAGGIGIVEMLFRCNILALVGGGLNPRYPTNKVLIWDDHQTRPIGELSFKSAVKAVRLRRDRIVCVLETKVYVYNFSDLSLEDTIATAKNDLGLVALCPSSTDMVLACPGLSRGSVRVELYNIRRKTFINAHESDLAALALNLTGTRLATASDKGTLVRVYDTQTGALQQELRRGADRALVYSICFDQLCKYLACSSDKGTVHIFKLSDGTSGGPNKQGNSQGASGSGSGSGGSRKQTSGPGSGKDDNAKSTLRFMKGILPKYFSSEWSFAQFRIPGYSKASVAMKAICAFGAEENTLLTITADGKFLKCNFARGGDCAVESFAKFAKSNEGKSSGSGNSQSQSQSSGN